MRHFVYFDADRALAHLGLAPDIDAGLGVLPSPKVGFLVRASGLCFAVKHDSTARIGADASANVELVMGLLDTEGQAVAQRDCSTEAGASAAGDSIEQQERAT
jgi:hypothetical protein